MGVDGGTLREICLALGDHVRYLAYIGLSRDIARIAAKVFEFHSHSVHVMLLRLE